MNCRVGGLAGILHRLAHNKGVFAVTNIATVGQDKWFAALPQELADSVSTLDLRAPKVVGDDSARPRNSLNSDRWTAFQSGKLSEGIFASTTY